MSDIIRGDIQAALDFGRKTFEPRVETLKLGEIEAPVVLAANNLGGIELYSVKEILDEYREEPERRRGTIAVDDLESFIALVNRDKREESMIFAKRDRQSPRLTAVLDFHYGAGSPGWCEDRIRYTFPLSEEWKVWTANEGEARKKGQAEFAAFLEDNINDIGEPGAMGAITASFVQKLGVTLAGSSRLMDLSRGLAIRVEETVRNAVNLQTGEVQFQFGTEHKDTNGAPITVPAAFHLMIPIFQQGPLYSIPVRLRYRAGGGKIQWFYQMHRSDLFLGDAIDEVIARVRLAPAVHQEVTGTELVTTSSAPAGGCGLPVVLGTPPRAKSGEE